MVLFDVPCEPGQVVRTRVPVGRLADGTEVRMPVVVARGARPGPTGLLQAALHGNEVTGIEVCRQVLHQVAAKLDHLQGTIVGLPVVNVPAFLSRSRSFVAEERSPVDLNRVFPGHAGGLLTERIAALLIEEGVRCVDYAIDFHSALTGSTIAPFTYVTSAVGDPVRTGQETLAESLNLGFVYDQGGNRELGRSNMAQSFCAAAEREGVPAIIAEMGDSDRISWEYVPRGVAGTLDALRAMGNLVDGVDRPTPRNHRFSKIATVHAEAGGMLTPRVELTQTARRGDLLATVSDPLGAEPDWDATSPEDGHVLRLMTLGACGSGAELAWIAHAAGEVSG